MIQATNKRWFTYQHLDSRSIRHGEFNTIHWGRTPNGSCHHMTPVIFCRGSLLDELIELPTSQWCWWCLARHVDIAKPTSLIQRLGQRLQHFSVDWNVQKDHQTRLMQFTAVVSSELFWNNMIRLAFGKLKLCSGTSPCSWGNPW